MHKMQNTRSLMLDQEAMIESAKEHEEKYCQKITDAIETIDRLYKIVLRIRKELLQSEETIALMEKYDRIKTELIKNLRSHMSEKDTLIEQLSSQKRALEVRTGCGWTSQDDEEDNLDPNGAMPQFNFMLGNL